MIQCFMILIRYIKLPYLTINCNKTGNQQDERMDSKYQLIICFLFFCFYNAYEVYKKVFNKCNKLEKRVKELESNRNQFEQKSQKTPKDQKIENSKNDLKANKEPIKPYQKENQRQVNPLEHKEEPEKNHTEYKKREKEDIKKKENQIAEENGNIEQDKSQNIQNTHTYKNNQETQSQQNKTDHLENHPNSQFKTSKEEPEKNPKKQKKREKKEIEKHEDENTQELFNIEDNKNNMNTSKHKEKLHLKKIHSATSKKAKEIKDTSLITEDLKEQPQNPIDKNKESIALTNSQSIEQKPKNNTTCQAKRNEKQKNAQSKQESNYKNNINTSENTEQHEQEKKVSSQNKQTEATITDNRTSIMKQYMEKPRNCLQKELRQEIEEIQNELIILEQQIDNSQKKDADALIKLEQQMNIKIDEKLKQMEKYYKNQLKAKDRKIQQLQNKVKHIFPTDSSTIFLDQLKDDYTMIYEKQFNLIDRRERKKLNRYINYTIYYTQEVYNKEERKLLLDNIECSQREKIHIQSLLTQLFQSEQNIQIVEKFIEYINKGDQNLTCCTDLGTERDNECQALEKICREHKMKQKEILKQLVPFIKDKYYKMDIELELYYIPIYRNS